MKRLILLLVMFLISCGVLEEEPTKEDVEVFIGNLTFHEESTYAKINSYTMTFGEGDDLRVEAYLIEDFYDENDHYLETHLTHSTTEDGDDVEVVNEPHAILLDDETDIHQSIDLSESEQEQVLQHIEQIFDSKH
ncbi:hypothetical protein [Alkalibacillus aidingensis]|uniref:hypothetical protein n=1 Tax=Alkalibacillus aidingensis TaxID=2747607 RepID=UPI0016605DCE|nr:hypothetical protein [Alkalibacillus aidingensis]